MCTRVMVCHGDRAKVLKNVYSDAQTLVARKDSKVATYYITRDGKYAVDTDYASISDLEKENLNLNGIPKVILAQPDTKKKTSKKK
jgi:hypothetical protein